MTLRLDWATHEAAVFACQNWHYSKTIPVPPLVKIGVWEDDAFIGVVLFSRGASPYLLKPYGLKTTEGCELTRVALRAHRAPVTRILSVAFKLLRKQCPGLRLIVSFADPYAGHHGGIYQGGNWIYCGSSGDKIEYVDRNGRRWHDRQVSETGMRKNFGVLRKCPKPSECTKLYLPGKHRYLMPLDAEMRAQVESLRQPFPRRKQSVDAPSFQEGERGSIPTPALLDSTT